MDDEMGFSTNAIHSGTHQADGAVNTPVYLSSTYRLDEERYAGWAAGAQHTLLYARLSSVNSEVVAKKIATLEGAEDGEVFSSGMSAISTTLLGLLSRGDHLVTSPDVYGGTYGLMVEDLPRFGIEVTMADIRDPASYEAAIQPNTKMLYCESLTNPTLKVCDLEAISEIARKYDLISVVDNTFTTPWAIQPISMGHDLVIHSTTKFLNGHSDHIGGAVVGKKDLISKIFSKKIHFGGSADPHSCFMLERGLKTLGVRMPTHVSNATELARRLIDHPSIEKVIHPSLPNHPDFDVAQRIMPKGTGMLAFVIKGGDKEAMDFMSRLSIIFEATSLGGVESLIEAPTTSSHMFIPPEVRLESGIAPGFIRLSVGLENVEDLWSDISHALEG